MGALLYQLTTGRPPFAGDTPGGVLRLVEVEDPVPPRRLNPGLPRDLETIVLKCLEKRSARRYVSAQALVDDLERARISAYAGDIALADRAIEDGDLARTRELLEAYIPHPGEPDLRSFEWRLLWQASEDQSRTALRGHAHVVSGVAFLDGGARLASGSWDGTVRVWSVADDGGVVAVYSPQHHGCAFWAVDAAKCRFTVPQTGGVLAMDHRFIVSVPTWETPRVLEAHTGRHLADLVEHKERVSDLVLLPDSPTVVTAAWDGTLRFWELPFGRCLAVRRSQRQGIYALALSPDRQTLVAGGQDGTARFWNLATRQETMRWIERVPLGRVWFAPDGNTLVGSTGNHAHNCRMLICDPIVRAWPPRRIDHDETTSLAIRKARPVGPDGSSGGHDRALAARDPLPP